VVSARWLRHLALAALALGACGPDRYVDPHVSCDGGPCGCVGGFDDCDGNGDNGCESDLASDEKNCGACGNACDHGTCVGGACSCAAGFADCDGDPTNGCEADTDTDASNCGACQHDCAGAACAAGVCQTGT
jgi:hypothetical protein